MGVPCFYHPELHEGIIELGQAEARHVVASRRLRIGDELRLVDGMGRTGDAVVHSHDRGVLRVRVTATRSVGLSPLRRLSLLSALPKGARNEYLFEKCTELGVGSIVAVNFARSVVRAHEKPGNGWQRTCIEAAKQSGQAWVPQLSTAETLAAAVAALPARAVRLVAEPTGRPGIPPGTIRHGTTAPIAAIIGPEGGLTPDELLLVERRGFVPFNLGPAILRIETACVAMAVRVQAALEAAGES